MMIARLCYDILMNSGLEAYESAKAHRISQAYEDVAEALTLLSGLGLKTPAALWLMVWKSIYTSSPNVRFCMGRA